MHLNDYASYNGVLHLYIFFCRSLASKVIYFMSVDDSDVHSSQLPVINNTKLQQVVDQVIGTGSSVIEQTSSLYSYSRLFNLRFTHPVIEDDIQKFRNQMAGVWKIQTSNGKIIVKSF